MFGHSTTLCMKELIASDKCNLLRKVHFVLKSGFQVIAFLILLEVGYLVIKCRKLCLQTRTRITLETLQNNV